LEKIPEIRILIDLDSKWVLTLPALLIIIIIIL